MKAILEIDIPDTCGECPCCQQTDSGINDICMALSSGDRIKFTAKYGRIKDCPLKPIERTSDGYIVEVAL